MTRDRKPKSTAPSNSSLPASDPNVAAKPIRLLRLRQVLELVGLKRATVYELQRNGQFPHNVKITSRAVGWVEEEVQRWLAERRDRRS